MDYYEVESMANDIASEARRDAERYTDRELDSARQDWRTSISDVREGLIDANRQIQILQDGLRELQNDHDALRREFDAHNTHGSSQI